MDSLVSSSEKKKALRGSFFISICICICKYIPLISVYIFLGPVIITIINNNNVHESDLLILSPYEFLWGKQRRRNKVI